MQLELWREGEQAGAGDEKAEQGHLYTVPTREQGNIYKPNNKDMADEMNERQVYDAHTKEIDLVNRDPKHLNDHVVKRKIGWLECQHVISMPLSYLSPWFRHTKQGAQGALVVFPNGVSTLLCCQWLHEVSLDLGTSKCPSCLQCLAQRRDLKSLRSALLMPVPHQSRWVN
ncbi:PREDICTED: caveolin-1 isoform X6 [Myotis brandtii]|uniref:caveolin-1 isoform X6 n=1 Tax=Myotis brandtii TaxID=109478 RepID=UPI0007046807|nr:PREDICTED: caveolin-1 isoform X6 [Myotis brandtii]